MSVGDANKEYGASGVNPIQSYQLIKSEDLHWRPSNLMKIPNADYLERTKSENLGARLWRLRPRAQSPCSRTSARRSLSFGRTAFRSLSIGIPVATIGKSADTLEVKV
jgi:hypothetical protein